MKSIPLPDRELRNDAEMLLLANEFSRQLTQRRTVRDYSERAVSRELIEACLRAAGSAPSGANQQPWHFVAIADRAIKQRIRVAAEAEEREFYERRAPEEWLQALAALGTDASKPFLEVAPWLIAVFYERTGPMEDGRKSKRHADSRPASGRTCHLDAYAEPDGLSQRNSRSAKNRGSVSAAGGRSPRRKLPGAGYFAQTA
jgi:iodotyrosine deiodinase